MAEEAEKSVKLSGDQVARLAAQERRKLDGLGRRIETFQGFRNELSMALDSVKAISKTEKGEKILINLGAGIFAEAALQENSRGIATIAGNVFNYRGFNDLEKTLEAKMKNVDKAVSGVITEQQKALSRLNQLEQLLEAGRRYMQQRQPKQ